MSDDCDVCGGARFIRLPRRPKMSVTEADPNEPPKIVDSRVATFPCPECRPNDTADGKLRIPATRFAAIADVVDAAERYKDAPGYLDHVERDVAHRLAAELLKRGMIQFERQHESLSGRFQIRGTVYAASPDVTISIEQRTAERQDERAAQVVEAIKAKVSNWGSTSRYVEHRIDKSQVYYLIDSAFRAPRDKWVKL